MLFFNLTHGQKKVLEIVANDSTSVLFLKDIHYQKVHFSEISLLKSLDSVKFQLEQIGFVNYSIRPPLTPPKEGDTIVVLGSNELLVSKYPPLFRRKGNSSVAKEEINLLNSISKFSKDTVIEKNTHLAPKEEGIFMVNDKIYKAYFNLGNQIQKIRIYYDDNEINLKLVLERNKKTTFGYFEVEPKNLSSTLQEISNALEKVGNSFSEVSLKNILIKNDTLIEAELEIKKSISRKIDKIIISGYPDFPKTYFKYHLALAQGTVFSKNKLDKASDAINTLDFVSEIKPPEVLFTKDSTIVYLYLKKENANRFDGLIGFTSKETGKGLALNGYLDLSLNNLFHSGENFNLTWKNNGNNRQVFNIDFTLPYIFNSKLSVNGALNIYKQDSSFVNTALKLALPYRINVRNSIGLILHSESSSNLLTITDNDIEDYNNLFYGMNYNYIIPNNHLLFKSKFNFYSEALMGKRKSITDNNQSKFYLKTNYLLSLNHKNHVFVQNNSGIINSEKLYSNEVMRVGGSNSIRGFDEESILASAYSIFNLEYRYTTNNSSYLYSISDLGYIDNKISNFTSQIYAFGFGYAFSSKLGFVNLSYALGKTSDTSFNFDNSRFHIKIVNFF